MLLTGWQLSGADSGRVQLGDQTAAGAHQKAGIVADAVSAGGGWADGSARRRAVASRLCQTGGEKEPGGGQGDGGAPAGSAIVLDAPQSMDIYGAGTSCG